MANNSIVRLDNGDPMKNLSSDEIQLLESYRRAKQMGYADISITIQEGSRVKLWLTEKIK